MNKKTKQYKYTILLALIILGGIFYVLNSKSEQTSKEMNPGTVNPDKIMDTIKHLESENPPILGQAPTEEDIYNSLHIKQIRIALNGYLDGTNSGLEEGALDVANVEMKCGLNNFSKTYYQSQFVVLDAYDNDWGGIQAYITFIDKPDTIFWVWIYGVVDEQRLRMFCEKAPPEDDEVGYRNYIDAGINNSNFRL